MSQRPFYVTTPIYYVNDIPHIGHAYTTVVADVLARYHRLFGDETFFLTGTDEHGQKVQASAEKKGIPPQAFVDQVMVQFQNTWKEIGISNDVFMRTTYDYHIKCVQTCLQQLFDSGDIYAQDYEGWYSVSEEIFYTEKDLVDGKSPTGNEVHKVREQNYFFRMSKYQTALIDYIEANTKFIQPEYRRNEVLGFLRKPLGDLCISRPKTRLTWGIELPFDKNYVTYVWFDALLNYASGIGLHQGAEGEKQFNHFWPHAVHLIGKDILITHTVYWTTMLLAMKLPMPHMIFAHGWWLTESNEKMSKSKGSVIKPLDVKDIVGVDGLRYFLTRDIHFGNDAQFSVDLVVSRVNTELANNLGNMLSRATNLVIKYFDGKIPVLREQLHPESKKLAELGPKTAETVRREIENMSPNNAVGAVVELLTTANQYLENLAPWKTAKTDLDLAGESLYFALETLRISAILLTPVMPEKMAQLLKIIGWQHEAKYGDALTWGLLKHGTLVSKPEPLFPRVEWPRVSEKTT